ncbi:DUF1269 domain-containing protein [Actinomadura logoneensis]|uniref:DUF1269 domain-containing protein n=1 Tax=Actinomadura logoneensis TaxID=2293572 RepID=A0A372JDY2_9ACTN|nr:DUF1269 domain-containing protein [Actinomadura logoneensis]RFU38054.1 DUF1269 domain-containing protein [Actinomadura logoneensis]
MSDLVAIAYDDVETAERVRDLVGELQMRHVIEVADAVVVERREDGKIKLHQSLNTVAGGAAGGALWGGLIGLLFLQPLLGAAIGGATGAAVGAVTDLGINDEFMRRLGEGLRPGAAAVFLLVKKTTPDKVLPELAQFGGQVIQTSLSEELEEQLRDALQRQPATAAAEPQAQAQAQAQAEAQAPGQQHGQGQSPSQSGVPTIPPD